METTAFKGTGEQAYNKIANLIGNRYSVTWREGFVYVTALGLTHVPSVQIAIENNNVVMNNYTRMRWWLVALLLLLVNIFAVFIYVVDHYVWVPRMHSLLKKEIAAALAA